MSGATGVAVPLNVPSPGSKTLVVYFESAGKTSRRPGARALEACRRGLAAIIAGSPGAWRMVTSTREPQLAAAVSKLLTGSGGHSQITLIRCPPDVN